MSQGRHVHANLVGASGVDIERDQGKLAPGRIELPGNAVIGDRFAAFGAAGGHAGAADGVAADDVLDRPFRFLQPAVNESDVLLLDLPGGELLAELAVGGIVLGDYQQATGAFVEAVDDAGAKLATDRREAVEMVQQSIDEGA